MKYELSITKKYKKSVKRLARSGYDLASLKDVVNKLQNGETLESKYMDHALIGNFCRIQRMSCCI